MSVKWEGVGGGCELHQVTLEYYRSIRYSSLPLHESLNEIRIDIGIVTH